MMKEDLTKYRVTVLPRTKAKYVAAVSHEAAVQGCFPDHDIEFYRDGYRWFQYKIDPPVSMGWPEDPDGDDEEEFGDVIDVEEAGDITVITVEQDDETVED